MAASRIAVAPGVSERTRAGSPSAESQRTAETAAGRRRPGGAGPGESWAPAIENVLSEMRARIAIPRTATRSSTRSSSEPPNVRATFNAPSGPRRVTSASDPPDVVTVVCPENMAPSSMSHATSTSLPRLAMRRGRAGPPLGCSRHASTNEVTPARGANVGGAAAGSLSIATEAPSVEAVPHAMEAARTSESPQRRDSKAGVLARGCITGSTLHSPDDVMRGAPSQGKNSAFHPGRRQLRRPGWTRRCP